MFFKMSYCEQVDTKRKRLSRSRSVCCDQSPLKWAGADNPILQPPMSRNTANQPGTLRAGGNSPVRGVQM